MNGPPIFDPETGEILDGASAPSDRPSHIQAMSLDDARALLVKRHSVAIAADDPILMLVTLHQGLLHDYDAMLSRHDQTIKRLLGATGDACAEAVEKVLSSLKDRSVLASVEQAFALVSTQAIAVDRLELSLKRHRRIIGLFSVLCMASAALAIAILFTLLK